MKSALVIDDDATFREMLAMALGKKGFETKTAENAATALRMAAQFTPEYTVLDLRLGQDSGLALIPRLLRANPFTRIVVLTGYANVATAVEAIKLGAVHYLAKPVGVDDIIGAFTRTGGDAALPVTQEERTVLQVEWDHIRTVMERNGGNVSATARELRMHRRTLQRKLDKMPAMISVLK